MSEYDGMEGFRAMIIEDLIALAGADQSWRAYYARDIMAHIEAFIERKVAFLGHKDVT